MKSLTRRKEMINWMWVAICLAMPLAMSLSCCHSRVKMQYIGPIAMYFEIQRKDSTVVISFGEREDSVYANYFETYESSDCGGFPFYFVIDNVTGIPKVRHVFFPNLIKFFDIHIPDYPYSIDYFVTKDYHSFRAHVEELTEIPSESTGLPHYYVVKLWLAAYDRHIDYRIYDIGDMDDIDSYIPSFVHNPRISLYSDLQQAEEQLDYMKNVINHGEPAVSKRFTVTERDRKNMIASGWLFLDTLDTRSEPVLEIVKWKIDNYILSVIYRIDSDGERIPVNGARYIYSMERNKKRIYYQ